MRKTLVAALMFAFAAAPASSFAHPNKKADTAETKPMSSPQDDQTFASHMAQHHRDGIAMADAEIARGASDDVKAMAKRIKADQEKDLASLDAHKGKASMMPKDPDMERGMAKLKAAKGTEADRLFLELMIAHHASAIGMTQPVLEKLSDNELKTMAQRMFSQQARQIGELEKLRESNQFASK